MTVEIISLSISAQVWDRARIELATPGSAFRLASVATHVTVLRGPVLNESKRRLIINYGLYQLMLWWPS